MNAPPPDLGAPARTIAPSGELERRRVLRAIRERQRYRYVKPELRAVPSGWIVVSPCCSRNIDPEGGCIDIAWLQRKGPLWRLHYKDHEAERWELCCEGPLHELLEAMRLDPERLFWP